MFCRIETQLDLKSPCLLSMVLKTQLYILKQKTWRTCNATLCNKYREASVLFFHQDHSLDFNKWTKVRYPSSEIYNMWFKMSHIFGGWGIFVCFVSKNKPFHTYTFGPSVPCFHGYYVCIHCKIFIGNHRTLSYLFPLLLSWVWHLTYAINSTQSQFVVP